MQIPNGEDDLGRVEASHGFFKSALFVEEVEELSALHESHHEEYLLVVLEDVVH